MADFPSQGSTCVGPHASPINVFELPEIKNGTWWIGGVDSGVSVAYPPTVGDNGNWWVDGKDTGYPVNVFPEITPDGYWSINGEKTDIRATLFVDSRTITGDGSIENPISVNELKTSGFIRPVNGIFDSVEDLPQQEGYRALIFNEDSYEVAEFVNGSYEFTAFPEGYCVCVGEAIYVNVENSLVQINNSSTGQLFAKGFYEETPDLQEGESAVVKKQGDFIRFLLVSKVGGRLSSKILKEGEEVRFIDNQSSLYGRKFYVRGQDFVEISARIFTEDSLDGDGSSQNPLRVPFYYL